MRDSDRLTQAETNQVKSTVNLAVPTAGEEALGYVADELKKAYDAYGPRSVLNCASKGLSTVINALGGGCTVTDTSSCGTLSNGTAVKMGLGFLN